MIKEIGHPRLQPTKQPSPMEYLSKAAITLHIRMGRPESNSMARDQLYG